ncbi:MAG: ABC transporter ATP-binding protein [Syntrophaceae bacterium]|nr:ABC transporter ATP-binding protein [Syntrophaceae bacterium]
MTTNDILIKADGVSKKFCRSLKKSLWYGFKDISSEALGYRGGHDRLRSEEFWAVKDISFDLKRGECLGIIGRNGAGKTTLLKMLNGLIKPDKGCITIRGRVGALIALGAGFNPILTGRENIYVNGSVLGLSKREIDEKIEEIIDFSEVREFIDSPVQSYSSGMQVRLGFAIAASLQPDVLLIDEVLAVGDVGFQTKCFNLLNRQSNKTTVVFVSHMMNQVARIANKIIVMEKGMAAFQSNDVAGGIEHYNDSFKNEGVTVTGTGKAVIEQIRLYGEDSSDNESMPIFQYGSDITIELDYRLHKNVQACVIAIGIFDQSMRMIAQSFSRASGISFENNHGIIKTKIIIPRIPLAPGLYSITIGFTEKRQSGQWGEHLARYEAIKSVKIIGNAALSASYAPIVLEAKWS